MGVLKKLSTFTPPEHYTFWNELLMRETKKPVNLQYGAMGENFTIEGLVETDVFVGDQLHIGELKFVVVKLREPCFKFNAKFAYKGQQKRCSNPALADGI